MKTCLIVEDVAEVSRALAGRVARVFPGIALAEAATLAEARRWLRARRADLILLDLGLPDGEGIALLTEGLVPAASMVVVTTVHGDDRHLFPALRAGASGYLLKEDPEDVFLDALRGILEGRPPLSASMARRMMTFFRAGEAGPGVELSPREREVLGLIGRGYSVRRAAEALGLAENTVAGYLKTVYQKLGIGNRAEAAVEAARLGLLGEP